MFLLECPSQSLDLNPTRDAVKWSHTRHWEYEHCARLIYSYQKHLLEVIGWSHCCYIQCVCINQPSLAGNVFLFLKDLGLKQDRQCALQFDYGYLLTLVAWCIQTLCIRQLISQHKQVEIHLETLSLYSAAQLQQVPEGECVKSHASLMLLVSAGEQSPQCWISSFLYIEQVEHEEREEK